MGRKWMIVSAAVLAVMCSLCSSWMTPPSVPGKSVWTFGIGFPPHHYSSSNSLSRWPSPAGFCGGRASSAYAIGILGLGDREKETSMAAPAWFDDLRRQLASRGLPPAYVERFVAELSDHLEDLKEENMSKDSERVSKSGGPRASCGGGCRRVSAAE